MVPFPRNCATREEANPTGLGAVSWWQPEHGLFFFPFFNVLLFIFERESASVSRGRGREREGQRTRRGLRAASRDPDAGLELMNREIMT